MGIMDALSGLFKQIPSNLKDIGSSIKSNPLEVIDLLRGDPRSTIQGASKIRGIRNVGQMSAPQGPVQTQEAPQGMDQVQAPPPEQVAPSTQGVSPLQPMDQEDWLSRMRR